MIVTIHQPHYLPWLGYFDKADRADILILLDDVQYKKNDWQNRNKIRTSQGSQWLTVPIISNFGQKIHEVQIDNSSQWRKAHLRAIELNYGKAKFFEKYIPEITKIYETEWERLIDINMAFLKVLIQWLNIETQIILSSNYQVTEESTQRLVDLCLQFKADTYLSGADGGKYLEFEKFEQNHIKVETQDYCHPVYEQLWCNDNNPFISHMCALDLLFNHGEESLKVLRNGVSTLGG